jgi:malonyl-CoA O-methyltransferase
MVELGVFFMQIHSTMLNKKLVRQHFDQHAFEYDRYAIIQRQMANQLMELLEQHFPQKKYSRILEIGCGTGILTEKLQKRWRSSQITAVDISEAMITQTKLKLGESAKAIRFIAEDAEELASRGSLIGEYDLIISNATFQWFQQPAETVKSLLSNLQASGGIFAFSTFGPRTFYELHRSFHAAEMLLGLKPVPHGQAFYPEAFWRSICSEALSTPSTFLWQQKEQAVFYPTVRDFLTSVKRVGAGNAMQSSGSQPQMRQLYKQMEAYYSQHFSVDNSIQATYDLSFGLSS